MFGRAERETINAPRYTHNDAIRETPYLSLVGWISDDYESTSDIAAMQIHQ